MAFTPQEAELIVQKVRRKSTSETDFPLAGKEALVLETIRRAETAHDEALELVEALPGARKEANRLRKRLVAALEALDETTINLAALDPLLDQSFHGPGNDNDLAGLLRRGVHAVDSFIDGLPANDTRRTRAQPGAGNADRPKTDGLKAIVGVLYDFWTAQTNLPFSDDIDEWVEGDGKKRAVSPALIFVFEVARAIDPDYTIAQCSNAMRPR